MNLLDPVDLASALIRCQSVTPADDGAQRLLAESLEPLGFRITRIARGGVENLLAESADAPARLAFAGHTDVVPPGEGWRHDPFGGTVVDGVLFGRGAVDMKGAIAAFVAALARMDGATRRRTPLTLLITGDEEGDATDGTIRILEHLEDRNRLPETCLVGEPTCVARLGDTVKIGRRGSVSAEITIRGIQGHVAYPHRADNPLHRLIPALEALRGRELDTGTAWFPPSTLQITTVDVGNRAGNVIPGEARAALNIRFNDLHAGETLVGWIEETVRRFAPDAEITTRIGGHAFLTDPGAFTDRITRAIKASLGVEARLDTGGGTSDARFIARHCPVAEFGLTGTTMHQIDEAVPVAELRALADVYGAILESVPA